MGGGRGGGARAGPVGWSATTDGWIDRVDKNDATRRLPVVVINCITLM